MILNSLYVKHTILPLFDIFTDFKMFENLYLSVITS